jgi:hypothetical protein
MSSGVNAIFGVERGAERVGVVGEFFVLASFEQETKHINRIKLQIRVSSFKIAAQTLQANLPGSRRIGSQINIYNSVS